MAKQSTVKFLITSCMNITVITTIGHQKSTLGNVKVKIIYGIETWIDLLICWFVKICHNITISAVPRVLASSYELTLA